MGLDMYLKAKRWMGKYNDKEKADEVRKLFPEIGLSDNLDSVEVAFEIGYWRKANQIHKWFVENIQEGEDDCGRYYASREKLEELRFKCHRVIEKAKTKKGKVYAGERWTSEKGHEVLTEDGELIENVEEISKILPNSEGFFFGSTEYNDRYIWQIKKTIRIIDACLKLPECWEFEYSSSW